MSHPSLQHRVKQLDSAVHHGGLRTQPISMIVMHDTMGHSARSSIKYMNETSDKSASYHYIIEDDGEILRMTAPNIIAYHAGDAQWPNPIFATAQNPKPHKGKSVNGFSIGIAFASMEEAPTDKQLESALWLCATIMSAYPLVKVERVRGHYEVSPGRKTDPLPQEMPEFRALLINYRSAA